MEHLTDPRLAGWLASPSPPPTINRHLLRRPTHNSSRRKMPPPHPFAVAFFYEPSQAAAIAAGVKLPQPLPRSFVNYDDAVAAGIALPLSHIHLYPNDPAPDAPPPTFTQMPLHSHIPLPSTMFLSTQAIHPKNFDLADAFVKILDYDKETMIIPDGPSTAAVLYKAGVIGDGGPNKLHNVKVRGLTALKGVLTRQGPILVELLELDHLSDAQEVLKLLKAKKKEGWECLPSTQYLSYLATISVKTQEVLNNLLPRLRKRLNKKKRGDIIKRRLRVIKSNEKKIRSKLRRNVLTPGICTELARAITRYQAKAAKKKPSYLIRKIDDISPTLLADLQRSVVFV